MSKKNWSYVPCVLGRTVLAFAFVFGENAWVARGQNAADKSNSSGAAKPNQAKANSSTASVAKPQSVEGETASKESSSNGEASPHGGQHEGIKVHGHWTIEVRNPDGALVAHREFENSLQGGPGGRANFLSSVLSRQNTVGNWIIFLSANFDPDSIFIDEAGTNAASQHASACAQSPTILSCSANLTSFCHNV
jgi:hypothetical protein